MLKEKEPIPSLESVINSLQEEDNKLHVDSNSSVSLASASAVSRAYVLTSPPCEHCGKTNHTAEKCFKVQPCNKCGKTGHPSYRCFTKVAEKKETKDKSRGKEKAAASSSENPISIVYEHDDIL